MSFLKKQQAGSSTAAVQNPAVDARRRRLDRLIMRAPLFPAAHLVASDLRADDVDPGNAAPDQRLVLREFLAL